jgi:ubiquinone/menaquinone biosynthesis C-methylase UbiE
VTANGPALTSTDRVLDAGGTASLFTCHLASRGAEVHSVDLNPALVDAGNETAQAMGWNMKSYCMDMCALEFEDGYFDHAYSICVFEHLESEMRQAALRELARVIKPGGVLSITFDYGGPGVYLHRTGPNCDPEHLIRTPEDIQRHFFSSDEFEPIGNSRFVANGKNYLTWPDDESERYTFGAVFLRRRG